jgi:hypothetical protein
MTPRHAMNRISIPSMKPWLLVTAIVLTFNCSLSLTGCKTRVVVIPGDKAVVRLNPDRAYSLAIPGWFVPDARMQEILMELGTKADALEKPKLTK